MMSGTRVHDLVANKSLLESIAGKGIEMEGIDSLEKAAQAYYGMQRFGTGDYQGYIDFTKDFREKFDLSKSEKPVLALFMSNAEASFSIPSGNTFAISERGSELGVDGARERVPRPPISTNTKRVSHLPHRPQAVTVLPQYNV